MHRSQRTRRGKKLQVLPIEAAEEDPEVEEAEEEVEAVVVGSEEDGDEVVAEDSKN